MIEVWLELADVEGKEVAVLRAGLQLRLQIAFPPDVEGINGDADERVIDPLGEEIGFTQGGDGGAVAGVHRVEGLDRKADVRCLGGRQKNKDAVFDLDEVFVRRLADCRAADEDDHWQAEDFGLLEGGEIHLDRGVAVGCCFRGEEAAADQGNGGEAGVCQVGADLFKVLSGDCFPPNRDAADACAGVVLDALVDRPRLVGEGVDGELVGVHGETDS